ncbi:MAG: hypothetical protein GWO87_02865 [Xanthomonadaceae bacterium]|nr:hypothetical protein [Rhodospirillaceae bacterium]NIA18103.1 hypothetical protein [Xanthomonadaceae bacterium]
MKIGNCPTMGKYTEEISKKYSLDIVRNRSAAEVLYNLSAGNFDIGLIGRKAEKAGFIDYEKRLKDVGYTLIYREKSTIDYRQLGAITVHTYLPENIVKNNFPEFRNIIYHQSLEKSLKEGKINLISWDDWDDRFNLLIPIDEFGNKIEKFRTPILYSKNEIIKEMSLA